MRAQAHAGPRSGVRFSADSGSRAAPGGRRGLVSVAREVGQKSGVLPALAENPILFPASLSGCSQLPGTPVPGDLMPGSH